MNLFVFDDKHGNNDAAEWQSGQRRRTTHPKGLSIRLEDYIIDLWWLQTILSTIACKQSSVSGQIKQSFCEHRLPSHIKGTTEEETR